MLDIGLTVGVGSTVIALGLWLYRRHISALRAEINTLKSANDLLRLGQYSEAWKQLSAQQQIFRLEKDGLEREIAELGQHGVARKRELEIANRQLAEVQQTLERLEEDRQRVADRVYRASAEAGGPTSDDPIEREALRKLRLWCVSISHGSPHKTIPDYLFSSSTYGEVAVSQVEQELMVRKGWIEEVENGVKITEQGRQAAGCIP